MKIAADPFAKVKVLVRLPALKFNHASTKIFYYDTHVIFSRASAKIICISLNSIKLICPEPRASPSCQSLHVHFFGLQLN